MTAAADPPAQAPRPESPATAIAMRGITKRFGEVVAVAGADLNVARGEIHALLGENGAGKTSLMNVLAGLYRPDGGEMGLYGERVEIQSPRDARRRKIGMVHQEQRLVSRFTAPENISLGHEEPRWLMLKRYFRRLAARVSRQYRLTIDAERLILDLPLGRRQRVELVKLLHHGAEIIILDEPTGNLAPSEVETFFGAIRHLVNNGRTVVLITHKLDEVTRFADWVTVMRAGQVVASFPTGLISRDEINRLMVGDGGAGLVEAGPKATNGGADGAAGREVLELRRLSAGPSHERESLKDVTLAVRGGEVLAIAGVAGNGQTLLAEAISGGLRDYRGRIAIGGRDLRGLGRRRVARLGLGYVPENRKDVGLVPGQSVAVNLVLRDYDRPPFSRNGWVDHRAIREHARQLIERYRIRTPSPDWPVGRLSGGNQQRVLIAREFSGNPRVILVDNFTRGLDPLSTEQFKHELFAHRDRGAACVWITSDLSDALECDRVAVLQAGRVVGVLERAEATREAVGLLMSGDHGAVA